MSLDRSRPGPLPRIVTPRAVPGGGMVDPEGRYAIIRRNHAEAKAEIDRLRRKNSGALAEFDRIIAHLEGEVVRLKTARATLTGAPR